MFVRHPKLPVDVLLDIQKPSSWSATQYGDHVQASLQEAYKLAKRAIEAATRKSKERYDGSVRGANPVVLVRNRGFKGKHKLANKWETDPYKVPTR